MRIARSAGRLAMVAAAVTIGPWAAGAQATSPGRVQKDAPPPAATSLPSRLAAGERAALMKLPPGPARDLVIGGCVSCHSASIIVMQRKDSTGWHRTVAQMVAWGAPVPEERRPELIAYLARHFPGRAAGAAPRP